MPENETCIFCSITAGEKDDKEKILYRDQDLTVFSDRQPRAPIHLLIVPRHHYLDFVEMMENEPELAVKIKNVVEKMVEQLGLEEQGYTWGFHGGGKQSVDHVHAQLISGMKPGELVL